MKKYFRSIIENFAGINILGFIKCVSRFTRMIAGTICIIPKFAHKLLRHWYPGNLLRRVLMSQNCLLHSDYRYKNNI